MAKTLKKYVLRPEEHADDCGSGLMVAKPGMELFLIALLRPAINQPTFRILQFTVQFNCAHLFSSTVISTGPRYTTAAAAAEMSTSKYVDSNSAPNITLYQAEQQACSNANHSRVGHSMTSDYQNSACE